MITLKKMVHVCGVLLLLFIAAGCSKKETEKTVSAKAITVATTSESGSLDPAGVIANTYLAYSVSALDELLTFDGSGNILYRGAESHEQSSDALVWTFHLRRNAKWSDGSPVTAKDYINTAQRALNPKCGNGYSDYLFYIENARKIYRGEAALNTLGIEAPDDYTLVFKLETPCVFFLDLLRLPVYTPSYSKYATDTGTGWDTNPATSVANGPFYLSEYVSNQYFILKKNEHYWDKDRIKLDQITYRFLNDQQATANAYKTNEVDIAPLVQAYIIEQYKGKPDLVMNPMIATRYFYPNLKVAALQDVRVRKAIALAINRKELCEIVGADTVPTYNHVAKFMRDKTTGNFFVDDVDPMFKESVEEAKRLLAEAGYPDGAGFPNITYNYPSIEMDSDTAQVLQAQLKENLNINVTLNAQELQVNYSERRQGNFQLCRMNWTADFADPSTYLSMLATGGTYNCSGVSNAEYDSLLAQSDAETDPVKRAALLHRAEKISVGDNFYIIPLFAMTSVNLVNPRITGINTIAASGVMEYRYADINGSK
ncbi:peptide ABC transporter substrate-binding protein [Spirochaetia bacterium]|nr:peptide ABC transporter substrate-binding protein [Spirochaetia bacterium]